MCKEWFEQGLFPVVSGLSVTVTAGEFVSMALLGRIVNLGPKTIPQVYELIWERRK